MNGYVIHGWGAVLYASLMLGLVFISLVHLFPTGSARRQRRKPKASEQVAEARVRPELSDPDGRPWPPELGQF